MLAAQIDAVLTDFTRQRVPFSHRDVAERIPGLAPDQLDEVRCFVFKMMSCRPAYRLSIAHFVGEGLTLVCTPCDLASAPAPAAAPLPLSRSWQQG